MLAADAPDIRFVNVCDDFIIGVLYTFGFPYLSGIAYVCSFSLTVVVFYTEFVNF